MLNNLDDKTYFNAGDIVQLKLNIPNKPKMVVIKKVNSIFKQDPKKSEKGPLRGIKCMWFTNDGFYQENTFNTKDLILISTKD